MTKAQAICRILIIRDEVVMHVGICGRGTHPLTELIEALEAGEEKDLDLEQAVEQAERVKNDLVSFR